MVIDATHRAGQRPAARSSAPRARSAMRSPISSSTPSMRCPKGGTLTLAGIANLRSTQARHQVELEVRDTGIGMDEETRRALPRAFLHDQGRARHGTGPRDGVRHGAAPQRAIEIDSAPGRAPRCGCSFVRPPRRRATASAAPTLPSDAPLRLLVIDDDPLLLKSLRTPSRSTATRSRGRRRRPRPASTPFNAAHEAGRFDVVMTDLGMPYVDGRKVAPRSRQHRRHAGDPAHRLGPAPVTERHSGACRPGARQTAEARGTADGVGRGDRRHGLERISHAQDSRRARSLGAGNCAVVVSRRTRSRIAGHDCIRRRAQTDERRRAHGRRDHLGIAAPRKPRAMPPPPSRSSRNEDIRRSGATTIPEALRLVPGMHVGRQQSSSTWAVSSRGFSSVNSEKLLVLTDTRSIYTPLFSGVFWDVQDYLLRGHRSHRGHPRARRDAVGLQRRQRRHQHHHRERPRHAWRLCSRPAPAPTTALSPAARYGGETRRRRALPGVRQVLRSRDAHRHRRASCGRLADRPRRLPHRLGQRGARDQFTVQGDAYCGEIGQLTPVDHHHRPARHRRRRCEVGRERRQRARRWRRSSTTNSDCSCAPTTTTPQRDDPSFVDTLHTLRHRLSAPLRRCARHEIIWGAELPLHVQSQRGRRHLRARSGESPTTSSSADSSRTRLRSTTRCALTLGTKLEHNDFSGFEVQPSVRLAWTPRDDHTLWAAVSRAVRVPTRFERDIAIDVSDPAGNPVVRLLGNDDFDAEELIAYEPATAGAPRRTCRSTWPRSTITTRDWRRSSSARRSWILPAAAPSFRSSMRI